MSAPTSMSTPTPIATPATPTSTNMITLSLWLPLGRSNFYSIKADATLLESPDGDGPVRCSSERLADPTYVPRLRASVMRRLLEVLPLTFGYGGEATCDLEHEPHEQARPTRVTVTLRPGSARLPDTAGGPALANRELVAAGIDRVELQVEENGYYTFKASLARGEVDDAAKARAWDALHHHACEVFGGDFTVERLTAHAKRGHNEGAAATRRYNGLDGPATVTALPKGVLIFYQLNILVEGLCNESLLPAVFFERYGFVQDWLRKAGGATSLLRRVRDVVNELATDADASDLTGQVHVLHRFLAVTSRASLLKLKWSVESVRRSLLDQMMGVMHRQARLVQLDLGSIRYERSPELADEATESQMRGYVMLLATKLPLVSNVGDAVTLAVDHIKEILEHNRDARRDHADHNKEHSKEHKDHPGRHGEIDRLVRDLSRQLHHWNKLLKGLYENVHSLRDAVEHDWQERLLYEQEQSRSEQEAMAEIERSRRGRPESRRVGDTAYNAMMLILTAVTVVFAVATTNVNRLGEPGVSWWHQVSALWPIGIVAVFLVLVVPSLSGLGRVVKDRLGTSDSYSFEFAFSLDERTTPTLISTYLAAAKRQRIKSDEFRRLMLSRLGGSRIERVSPDTTLVKVHSVVSVQISSLRHARFEVVNEILARTVSDHSQYFLRQIRMFGDSPKALAPKQVVSLVRTILDHVGTPLAADGSIDVDDLLAQAVSIYTGRESAPGISDATADGGRGLGQPPGPPPSSHPPAADHTRASRRVRRPRPSIEDEHQVR